MAALADSAVACPGSAMTVPSALTMVATNTEMKQLYHYLKTREKSPLRKMQALIVVSKKILTLIHTLAKKEESYDPEKVFGDVRREQFKAAA